MTDYSYAYKKSFMDRLGLPVEQFDDVIETAKPKVNNMPLSEGDMINMLEKSANDWSEAKENFEIKLKRPLTDMEQKKLWNISNPNNKVSVSEAIADDIKTTKGAKTIGGKTFPLSPENAKALGRAVDDDYAASIRKVLSEQGVFNTAKKPAVGKVGAALRGVGKVASKLAGPVGAALTALDLGQALSEVQDLGAAKIAEDYKNSQLSESEDTGDKMMVKMEPMERGVQKDQEYMTALKKEKQYTPEERMKLKEMLSKYRANAALRSEE